MAITQRAEFAVLSVLSISSLLIILPVVSSDVVELFFVLSILVTIFLRELTAPTELTIEWRERVDRVIVFGIFVFSLVVIRRIAIFILEII
jgi:hypothetical protein